MRTDDLIRALASDTTQPRILFERGLLIALAAGFAVSLVIFMLMLGPRPDIATVSVYPRFLLKFAVTLSLAGAAAVLSTRLVRPGMQFRPVATWLALAPALLAGGVVLELIAVSSPQWGARLVGSNWLVCLTFIPVLSAPLLAGILLAFRIGAPTRTTFAGATAGLLASAVGASLYAAHCTDDSPLFVATWYTIAVALVVGAGAIVGRRVLRW